LVFGLVGTAVLSLGIRSSRPRHQRPLVGTSMALGGLWIGYTAAQYPVPLDHWLHFYWDRYPYAELLPTLVVLAAIGAGWFVERASGRLIGLAVSMVLLVGAAGLDLRRSVVLTDQAYLGSAYSQLREIDDALPEDAVVYWAGPPIEFMQLDFFFNNSFRIFATPLAETFQLQIVNLPADPFAPDPSLEDVAMALGSQMADGVGSGPAYVLVATADSVPVQPNHQIPSSIELRLIELVDIDTAILPQRATQPEDWLTFRYDLLIFEVVPAAP